MPDIVRLRYTGPHTVAVPVLGRDVAPGDIIDVVGKLVDDDDNDAGEPLPDDHDAFVVEFGNPPTVRAFPKSMWTDQTAEQDGE